MHSAAVHRAHHNHRVAMKSGHHQHHHTPTSSSSSTAAQHPTASNAHPVGSLRGGTPAAVFVQGSQGSSGMHRLAAVGNPSHNPGFGGTTTGGTTTTTGAGTTEAKRDAAQLLLWTINEWSKNKSQGSAGQCQGHLMPSESRRARRIQRKVMTL